MIQDILSLPLWILSSPNGGIFIELFLKSQFIVMFSIWFAVEWKFLGEDHNI